MSHGWWVVAFCFLAAVFTWGLGVFGASVYLHEVTTVLRTRGYSSSGSAFFPPYVIPMCWDSMRRCGGDRGPYTSRLNG